MGITRIQNDSFINKKTEIEKTDRVKSQLSESEKIRAIAIVFIAGFAFSWAAYEVIGRLTSETCGSIYKEFTEVCFDKPNLFCPLIAFNTAFHCSLSAAYQKVGSFWMAAGLSLVPAIYSVRKIVKNESEEARKTGKPKLPVATLDKLQNRPQLDPKKSAAIVHMSAKVRI